MNKLLIKDNDKILISDTTRAIKEQFNLIQQSFLKIAIALHKIKETKVYQELGYKSLYDYTLHEFNIKRTMTANLISIVEKFCYKDKTDYIINDFYESFSLNQLVELKALPVEKHKEITVDMSVRDIKKVKKELKDQESEKSIISNVTNTSEKLIIPEEPSNSEEPGSSEKLIISEEPGNSKEPGSSEKLIISEEPGNSEEPGSSEKLIISEEPGNSEEPGSSEVIEVDYIEKNQTAKMSEVIHTQNKIDYSLTSLQSIEISKSLMDKSTIWIELYTNGLLYIYKEKSLITINSKDEISCKSMEHRDNDYFIMDDSICLFRREANKNNTLSKFQIKQYEKAIQDKDTICIELDCTDLRIVKTDCDLHISEYATRKSDIDIYKLKGASNINYMSTDSVTLLYRRPVKMSNQITTQDLELLKLISKNHIDKLKMDIQISKIEPQKKMYIERLENLTLLMDKLDTLC